MQKNQESTNIIYLLGAGRSGTTLLATVLNNHPKIFTVGEMDQFLDYLKENKDCSCGKVLTECDFWSEILKDLDVSDLTKTELVDFSNQLENHKNIPLHLLKKEPNSRYTEIINAVFSALKTHTQGEWLLDSSKYISRFLLLRKNKNLNVKGIYLVRDVRGVVYSFGKKVQTHKNPLSAIVYYTLINLWAQLVCALDSNIIRLRYEDFVNDPDAVLAQIERHIFNENFESANLEQKTFKIPHIIAGNRLRSQKELIIKKDFTWKSKINRGNQILYYILALPVMLINRYKI